MSLETRESTVPLRQRHYTCNIEIKKRKSHFGSECYQHQGQDEETS